MANGRAAARGKVGGGGGRDRNKRSSRAVKRRCCPVPTSMDNRHRTAIVVEFHGGQRRGASRERWGLSVHLSGACFFSESIDLNGGVACSGKQEAN